MNYLDDEKQYLQNQLKKEALAIDGYHPLHVNIADDDFNIMNCSENDE